MTLPPWFRPFASARSTMAWLTGLALVLTLPTLLARDIPGVDLCTYYLRMARALAEGRPEAAHYHMIPPLFVQLVGGTIRLGLPVEQAARLVSLLAYAAGVPLVYLLLRHLYGHRPAAWGALLYVVSDRMLRIAINSGPDSLKTLLVIALALLLVLYLDRGWWWCLPGAGAAIGLMTLARSESLAFGAFLVVVPGWAWWRGRRQPAGPRVTLRAACWGGLLALATLGLVLAPRVAWQVRTAGLWVTDSRQLKVLQPLGLVEPETVRSMTYDYQSLPGAVRQQRQAGLGKLVSGVTGGFAFLLWPALLGLALQWRRPRRWQPAEWLLVALLLLNLGAFFLPTGYIIPRYAATTQPLLLGWAALALCAGLDLLRARVAPAHWRWAYALLAVILLALAWNGMTGIRPSLSDRKNAIRRLPREVAAWIAEHRQELSSGAARPATLERYHDGGQPLIMAARPSFAFLAGADYVQVSTNYTFPPAALVQFCRQERPDLLIVEPLLRQTCPGLEEELAAMPEFALARQWTLEDYTLSVYRYRGRQAHRPPAEHTP
jgi:4-amino-4-deoxy-L-arabinose transferase-like glycosyltransferase